MCVSTRRLLVGARRQRFRRHATTTILSSRDDDDSVVTRRQQFRHHARTMANRHTVTTTNRHATTTISSSRDDDDQSPRDDDDIVVTQRHDDGRSKAIPSFPTLQTTTWLLDGRPGSTPVLAGACQFYTSVQCEAHASCPIWSLERNNQRAPLSRSGASEERAKQDRRGIARAQWLWCGIM